MTTAESSRSPTGPLQRWLLGLIVLGMIWRCTRYALDFPLWGDEAFVANNIVLLDFVDLGGGLEHYQIVPWLFLALQWLLARVLGFSEHALRLMPLLAGIVGIVLYARLAKKVLPGSAGVLAVAFLAAAYYPARHAVEIKPYATDLLVAVLILLAAWRCIEHPRTREVVLLGAVTSAGVWASYPAVFVSCGAWLTLSWFCWRERRDLLPFTIGLGLACGASFVVMYLAVGRDQSAAAGEVLANLDLWARTFPPIDQPWRLPQWFVHVHLGRMFAYPIGGDGGGSALTFLAFCIGAVVVWRKDRVTAMLLLTPFGFTFIAAALQAYPYGGSARVAQHLAPAICLLAAAGVHYVVTSRFRGEDRERRVHWVLGLCALIILAGIARDIAKPYKTRSDLDNRRIVLGLLRGAPPGTLWNVFGNWDGRSDTPNFYDWAGPAARLRYYLVRDPDARVFWGADPLALPAAGRIKLLAYHSPDSTFPERLFDSYLARFQALWGKPKVSEHLFEQAPERIIVYSFAGGGRTGADRHGLFAVQSLSHANSR
jgi:4-amino-4-deoxy-L-arabinose transferase-like glycosyltransferase